MDNIIVINDLNFEYSDKQIFKNFNLKIEKNKITSIIGENGCGKSTLVKILCGLLNVDAYIKIDDLLLNNENIKEIRKKIGVVFSNPDNQFVAETVMDDIAFTLENMNCKNISKRVEEIASLFQIKAILEKNPHQLSGGEKQVVAIASALVHEPKILILDEALSMIDPYKRNDIYKILKELNITIINICHDMDEVIMSDNIVVIKDGKVLINEKKEPFFENQKKVEELKLGVPFIIDLCYKLKFYDLIDKNYYSMEELVDELWK